MKRILLLALFALLAANLTVAHQTVADSPATKEDVQKYLDATHSKDMMTKMMDAMAKPMHQMIHEQFLKDKEKLPADFEQRMNRMMDDYFKDLPLDEMLQAMVPAYQKHLTRGDLQAMTAFYNTPTGQKLVEQLPAITAEAMQAIMPVLRQRIDALNQRLQEEVVAMIKESPKPAGGKSQTTPN